MDQTLEARIRTRAYELWEKDASPEGKADEYWERALHQIDAEDGTVQGTPAEDQSAKRRRADPIPDPSESAGS
jgi:hypothetical protein